MFACTRKDRLLARSGSPYLALELRDRSGAIPARAFRDADVLAGRFERGDLVPCRGRVERFRDELQVEVARIERAAGADPADFLPVAYRDLDELDGFLEHLAREVHDRALAALLQSLLGDAELRARGGARRARAPATTPTSAGCSSTPSRWARSRSRRRSCTRAWTATCCSRAALVHDLGKTREFALGADIALSPEGRLLGHLQLGARIVEAHAGALPDDRRLALLHCVLGHHGPDALPGRRFAIRRGARALPAQRARRERQGRARARAAVGRRVRARASG